MNLNLLDTSLPVIKSSKVIARSVVLALALSLIGCGGGNKDEKYSSKLESAKNFIKAEKYQEARIELQTAIDLKPEDAEGYFQLAEVLVRIGEYGRALESYNSAINYNSNHVDARIHLASLQLIAKQYEQAENNIEKALEVEPSNEDALILKSNLIAIGPRKKVDEGRKILKEILTKNPDSVPALGSLGHLELANENAKAAEEYFIKALKIEPSNQAIQIAVADLYARQGRLDEAQERLSQLVTENPSQTGLRYVLGEFFLRRGLNDNALNQYEEILQQDPLRYDARDKLYDMYLARQEMEKAKALATSFEEKAPSNPLVKYFQGRNYELEGNIEKALQSFSEALTAATSFAPAFRKAGIIELSTGRTQEGLEHLNQAISIDPNDVGARLAIAKTKLMQNDLAGAKENSEQILSRYPRQLGANIIRADVALLEGEEDKAKKVYEYLVESYPNLPIGPYKLGLVAEKKQDFAKAVEQYEKTLSFDQGALGAGRRLVLSMNQLGKSSSDIIGKLSALRESSQNSKGEYDVLIGSVILADPKIEGRFELAREKLKSALDQNPNLIGAYFALGGIDAMSGDLNAAADNYKKLLEKNPAHVPTRMLLALTWEQQANFEEAVEEYKKILEISPRFGPAANNLAYLLTEEIKDGDLNEALRLAELAKEELPRESSVADTLAWVYYKKGNARAALPLLNEAVRVYKDSEPGTPLNPEILFHLAIVQKELGDSSAAKEAIKLAIDRAKEKHPKYTEMKKLLDSLK